jgi:hypothetical protein
MPSYHFDENNRFIISDYQRQNPFTNTLPGIAGLMGIPTWVFYVNRGQGIASFGTENKDHPIMEFQPANKAYQSTTTLGFRTFIKECSNQGAVIYEPFAVNRKQSEQKMIISLNELEIEERSSLHQLRVEVDYFVLPYENVSGLIRQVKIFNDSGQEKKLEIVDGLPVIIPYGVTNYHLKEYNRTIEAWMEVSNRENNIPFFHCRSLPVDRAEVKSFEAGNFAASIAVQDGRDVPITAIVNPEVMFGKCTSFNFPSLFEARSLEELLQLSYYPNGRTPCALFGLSTNLAPGQQLMIYSVYGNARKLDLITEIIPDLKSEAFFVRKRDEANKLIKELIDPIQTKTAKPEFDAYCQQTFLDNNLRGGWPFRLGDSDKSVVYHMYSRKHGDPERDYNSFFLASEFYSQGNGNYRDICQNRRSEVWFAPFVEDINIFSFMSLIQTDGYNPLTVKGSKFYLPDKKRAVLIEYALNKEALKNFFKKPFTPGGLHKLIEDDDIQLTIPTDEFLNHAINEAIQYFDADFGEGYWTDHWIYNLDLVIGYLSIFPDQKDSLLFNKKILPFFESPVFVQPRNKKYVLADGSPRQYGAVVPDKGKSQLIDERVAFPNFVRTNFGKGEIYRTSLFSKFLILAIIKFATLDPSGMGIEMEADKPSWCDALNGLPGLFGSSMADSYDLLRLIGFLQQHLSECAALNIELPIEIYELMQEILAALGVDKKDESNNRDFCYWDTVSSAREDYREITRLGVSGEEKIISVEEANNFIHQMKDKLQEGINRALESNSGVPPTYFTYEVERYEYLRGEDGQKQKDEKGRPFIRALKFKQKELPTFLEGYVRFLKTTNDKGVARKLYRNVKESPLFDRKLKMYKTNVSLTNESMDIGRLRAFTPGWLENESVFLHMEYKYLLEILKAGLYEEFFEDIQHALIAFQDPDRYRRNPLENSSFLVSSAHPDEKLHGAGFVARLTGATAEFLSMYEIMMVGQNPFRVKESHLQLYINPSLPSWLFDEDGKLSFTFLGKCKVTYINPSRKSTFDSDVQIQKIQLHLNEGVVDINTKMIDDPYASMVRDGLIKKIDIYFSED